MWRILQTILGSAILALGFLVPLVRAAHLSRVPPDFKICLEEALGRARFDEMSHNRGAARTTEETSRLKSCGKMMEERLRRESRQETLKKDKPTQPLVKLSRPLGQCLHEKLGKAAFLAIKTGVRASRVEERAQGKTCLKDHGPPPIPAPPPPPPVEVEPRGGEQEVQPPSPTPSPPTPSSPPPQELPAELRECLLKEFGEEVFSEIKLGKRQATSEEIEKGKQCLEAGKLPVPPPPTEVEPPSPPPPTEVEPPSPPPPTEVEPPPPQRIDQSWNKCMLELVGLDALRAITSGTRSATPSELEAARICAAR